MFLDEIYLSEPAYLMQVHFDIFDIFVCILRIFTNRENCRMTSLR